MTTPAYPPLFDAFDRIRIINLAHRTDRRREILEQLRRVGMANHPKVAFFDAMSADDAGFFTSKGMHGNFRSYRAVITEAAEAGESVLVLEDDCDFLLPEIFDYRLTEEWDVFYGGYDATDPDDLPNSDIIGAHFMGFSRPAAQIAANYMASYTQPGFVPDARAAADPGFNPLIRPPSDGAIVWLRRAHPELKTVFAMLGVQRASRTDTGNLSLLDRLPLARDVMGWLRRLRSALSGRREWKAQR